MKDRYLHFQCLRRDRILLKCIQEREPEDAIPSTATTDLIAMLERAITRMGERTDTEDSRRGLEESIPCAERAKRVGSTLVQTATVLARLEE